MKGANQRFEDYRLETDNPNKQYIGHFLFKAKLENLKYQGKQQK